MFASRKIALPAAMALAAGCASAHADETYTLDPAHSQPRYEIAHMRGASTQWGSFGKLAGKVALDRGAKKGSVEVTIDTTSIHSHDPRVDVVLKGPLYFNVEKYPTMTFKSAKLDFDGDKVVAAEGELTMIGVTKPITLRIASFACGENPFNKKPMCSAEASASIRLSDWGMTAGIPNSSGDEVRLVIPIEAYRDDAG